MESELCNKYDIFLEYAQNPYVIGGVVLVIIIIYFVFFRTKKSGKQKMSKKKDDDVDDADEISSLIEEIEQKQADDK